ncbi:MAG: Rossmann-like and DUF2520 domain-containing protein [Candidatus Wenzhouxiangella sp. M2_3B_020]
MALTLHIVGCGRVGRTLARLWTEAGVLRIGWILNRTRASAEAAARFVGGGTPVDRAGVVDPDDWLMLAAPDGTLAQLAGDLAGRIETPPALAFHVSGAESAEVLRPLGCPVASIHPVRPFSDPLAAFERFAGTHALGEGDEPALDRLLPVFEAIGAAASRFRPVDKRRYHAATIAASNFLNVLDELALNLAAESGIDRGQALRLLVSLQRAALDDIERHGPTASLTGPIERGDRAMCERLTSLLRHADGAETLLALARGGVDLADRKHGRTDYAGNPLRELFADPTGVGNGESDAGV